MMAALGPGAAWAAARGAALAFFFHGIAIHKQEFYQDHQIEGTGDLVANVCTHLARGKQSFCGSIATRLAGAC